MEINENSGCNSDGGLNTLIYQEDLEDNEQYLSHPNSNQNRQQVSMFNVASGRHSRLVVVSLALLAAVLLIVDISLGVHYNKLTDNHLTIDDTEHIENEMNKLQDTYKTAIETMKGAKKQLDSEMSRQTLTNWELQHQTKRQDKNVAQIDQLTQSIASMKSRLPMINDGCRHCPPGWFSINSVCYFFAFSNFAGSRTWQKAREYCQMHGGDLVVIDSKDKENSTINVLLTNNADSASTDGFWIGLRYFPEEESWKWLDGTALVEGYWNDGEPNDSSGDREPCAAVYPRENFFEAWSSVGCGLKKKLICEKAPTSIN
uniref:C-type lectin domain-containing protein n=1 Tax=Scophthalmus maximus TaxID=52904 RepID=A0A8D3C291_SCOMX